MIGLKRFAKKVKCFLARDPGHGFLQRIFLLSILLARSSSLPHQEREFFDFESEMGYNPINLTRMNVMVGPFRSDKVWFEGETVSSSSDRQKPPSDLISWMILTFTPQKSGLCGP